MSAGECFGQAMKTTLLVLVMMILVDFLIKALNMILGLSVGGGAYLLGFENEESLQKSDLGRRQADTVVASHQQDHFMNQAWGTKRSPRC